MPAVTTPSEKDFVRRPYSQEVLGVGVGGEDVRSHDAHLGQAIDGVGPATPAANDLDVGLQAFQYLDELLVGGGVLLVGLGGVPTLSTSAGYSVAEE